MRTGKLVKMIRFGVSGRTILLWSSPAAPIWMTNTGNLLKMFHKMGPRDGGKGGTGRWSAPVEYFTGLLLASAPSGPFMLNTVRTML